MNKKALVLFSGGIDSATCLALAIKKYGRENVIPLSIIYGQKHEKEIMAAQKILEYYGIEGLIFDLTTIFSSSNCSLLKNSTKKIPRGTYKSQKSNYDSIVSTYVPFRNGLFLSVASSIALSYDCQVIYYGAHKDDNVGDAYPDCSSSFFHSMREAVYEGTGKQLVLYAPFIHKNKSQIVKEGLDLKVPYELTWSCYEGKEKPCRICATCIDRENAFLQNNQMDPLLYEEM